MAGGTLQHICDSSKNTVDSALQLQFHLVAQFLKETDQLSLNNVFVLIIEVMPPSFLQPSCTTRTLARCPIVAALSRYGNAEMFGDCCEQKKMLGEQRNARGMAKANEAK